MKELNICKGEKMANKVIIRNKLKENKEVAEKLEEEGRKRMLWGFPKDRTLPEPKKKEPEDKPKE